MYIKVYIELINGRIQRFNGSEIGYGPHIHVKIHIYADHRNSMVRIYMYLYMYMRTIEKLNGSTERKRLLFM